MQGISSGETFEKLIYSYSAMQVCRSERDNFVVCRATPHGREGDPTHCENEVNSLMTCYSSMVQKSQKECNKTYKSAFDCLKRHEDESGDSHACAGNLSEFAKCI
ncbi:unnamed protein product [Moneuplotes crassus]|uniref:Uncharacterized protein n=1 Tax=Euplotes crassus TaxID=5936 RepID=A0AAD1Y774_EUPCR|nr:unnamed protein product [Moneuplotes crassus]